MTEVAFHFNAPDKLGYACRLLRKGHATGRKVVVTGDAQLLRELDVALWTFEALEFVPHCYAPASPPELVAATPIVLVDSVQQAPHREVLVNLGLPVPGGFEAFEKLIEVVSTDDEDRQQGRQRWKHYQARGYAIVRHDVPAAEAR